MLKEKVPMRGPPPENPKIGDSFPLLKGESIVPHSPIANPLVSRKALREKSAIVSPFEGGNCVKDNLADSPLPGATPRAWGRPGSRSCEEWEAAASATAFNCLFLDLLAPGLACAWGCLCWDLLVLKCAFFGQKAETPPHMGFGLVETTPFFHESP